MTGIHPMLMNTKIKNSTIVLIIATLFVLVGCASNPPNTEYQGKIGKVAIVSTNQAPAIMLAGFSRSKTEGAWDTLGKAFRESLQGGGIGFLLLPIILPVAATVGAALAPSADTVKQAEEKLSKNAELQTLMGYLRDQVVIQALNNGTKIQQVSPELMQRIEQTANYRLLAEVGIQTVLKVVMTKVVVIGKDLNDPLLLQMFAHARLLRTSDNTEIAAVDAEYHDGSYTQSEWTANNSKLLLQALVKGCEAVSKHIYENMFMLYPFPDQSWTSDFPRVTLGLAPINPANGEFPSTQAALRWQAFPRADDFALAPEDMRRVKNVRYDLFVVERQNPNTIIFQREGIPIPEQALETPLRSGTKYEWSVRARFELDGRERVTEWSGLGMGLIPKFYRQYVPPLGYLYPFETPK